VEAVGNLAQHVSHDQFGTVFRTIRHLSILLCYWPVASLPLDPTCDRLLDIISSLWNSRSMVFADPDVGPSIAADLHDAVVRLHFKLRSGRSRELFKNAVWLSLSMEAALGTREVMILSLCGKPPV